VWNLGAGATLFSVVSGASTVIGPGAFVPGASASLERRVGPASWAVVGFSGNAERLRSDPAAEAGGIGPFGELARVDAGAVGLAVGLRQELTRPGGAVMASLVALADGGWARRDETAILDATRDVTRRSQAWRAGGSLGLAVDRELTGGLSVRVATPLVEAHWERREAQPAFAFRAATSIAANVLLAPRLELRLAF
jgi:hypothetical protein